MRLMEADLLASRAILHLLLEAMGAPSIVPSHLMDSSMDSSTVHSTANSNSTSSRTTARKLDLEVILATAAVRPATARGRHPARQEVTVNKLATAARQATAVRLLALMGALVTTTTINTTNMAVLPHTRTNTVVVPVLASGIILHRQDNIQVAMEARQDPTHRSQVGNM